MTKKPTKKQTKAKKINKTKDIVEYDPMETVNTILANNKHSPDEERRLKFHLLRFFGLPVATCAESSGYSETYGYKIDKQVKDLAKLPPTLQRFFDDMPARYKALAKARLPQIAQIEGNALDLYESNPNLAIDKPALLKALKQSAGALDVDGKVEINYNAIAVDARSLMKQIGNPEQVADAEIVSDSGDSDD